MPRGGYRPGSGRKPSSLNIKMREISERTISDGATPLEVMLDNMRFYHAEAVKLVERLLVKGVPQAERTTEGADAGKPHANVIEALREVLELRKLAGAEAARAASYVHPRMGYVTEEPNLDEEVIPLAVRMKEWERRDAIKAVGQNAVELKPQDVQSTDPGESKAIPPPLN